MSHPLSEQPNSDSVAFRAVYLNTQQNSSFITNRVITARYSIISWIPKSILIQFLRLNNVYYLVLSCLSFFEFSPKNPYSISATLIGVILFTMIKDGIEDIWRHSQDKKVNKSKFLKYNRPLNQFIRVNCEDFKVGDVVKILDNESFPADCVLLASSEPKGVAYLNTMSLDGENSLKEKCSNHLTAKLEEKELLNDSFTFLTDQPNKSLISWNANISNGTETLPLNMKQLMLRGCVLKNTEWALGIIIYTGAECKIVLNSKPARTKISNIQRKLNKAIITIMIFVLILTLAFGGDGKRWFDQNEDEAKEYIDLPSSYHIREVIITAVTYWIQLFSVIPISIFVVVEIMRLIFCSFIKNDTEMYNETLDRTANWRSSDIVEEMGQVEFIFSDKTGTLTKNEMELINCWIEGKDFTLNDSESFKELIEVNENSQSPIHETVKEYFTLLVLCNSVFPTLHEGKIVYHSISPDDIALVDAAKKLNFILKERNNDNFVVSIDGKEQIWYILAEIPFSSERKKMSIIVQGPLGQAYFFTKGADSVIIPKLSEAGITEETLLKYAKKGLRTLVMASRKVTQKKLQKWLPQYKSLMLSNSHEKDSELDKLSEKIEKKLKLLGVSAIEDKLQDGVPEAIELLVRANIRVWMITGDKEETAVEIGKSCKLIHEGSKLIEFYHHNKEDLKNAIKFAADEYEVASVPMEKLNELQNVNNLSLAFNGVALTFIIEDNEMSELFFKLAYISNTCICSRMSPIQKSEVVHLCKKYGKWISLAIGDGANDVAMIQEAHIGIGVAGKEGTQALLAAEFTIAQFSHLTRLLLVHGRYSYFRLTKFINYYFYKNFLMTNAEMWFALYNGFSGQTYYLDWIPPFFNLFWTSWPSLAFYALEQDISPKESLNYPSLYSAGQKNAFFSILIFWRWILFSFIAGTIIFWLPMGSLLKGMSEDGHEPTLFWISTTGFMLLMHASNLKLIISSRYWNKVNLGAIFFSFIFFYLCMIMLNSNRVAYRFQPELTGMFFIILKTGKTWAIVLIGSFVAMIPDFTYDMVKSTYFPTPTDRVMNFFRNPKKVESEEKHLESNY